MFKCQTLQYTFLVDVFVENSSIHNYHTRQRNLIHQPYARTHTALRSFRIVCVNKWNKLPRDIINSTTLSRFKILCKKHLFDRLQSGTWMYKLRWGSHEWSEIVCVCVCVCVCGRGGGLYSSAFIMMLHHLYISYTHCKYVTPCHMYTV